MWECLGPQIRRKHCIHIATRCYTIEVAFRRRVVVTARMGYDARERASVLFTQMHQRYVSPGEVICKTSS